MYTTSSHFSVSYCHKRVVAWLLLTSFCLSFVPSVSMAQQPTATLKTLIGDVLVSGQAVMVGTVLHARDTIRTQAGASAVLEFSDGSEIHLSEKTEITFTELTQTASGARVSSLKLLAGRVRALLSPEHQQEGSAFTVETPNARIGATFSQPDIEVSYNPSAQETIGVAHTVALTAKHLLTDETKLVPVGSTVIISSATIKIAVGIVGAAGSSGSSSSGVISSEAGTSDTGTSGTSSSGSSSTGMGTGTKVATGLGVAAVAGGIAALVAGSGGDNSNSGDESGSDSDGDSGNGMVEDRIYTWNFYEEGNTVGCVNLSLQTGLPINGPYSDGFSLQVEKTGDILTGSGNLSYNSSLLTTTVEGTISGINVQFRRYGTAWTPGYTIDWNYLGTIQGNRITGTFSGGGGDSTDPNAVGCSSSGTFTVTFQ